MARPSKRLDVVQSSEGCAATAAAAAAAAQADCIATQEQRVVAAYGREGFTVTKDDLHLRGHQSRDSAVAHLSSLTHGAGHRAIGLERHEGSICRGDRGYPGGEHRGQRGWHSSSSVGLAPCDQSAVAIHRCKALRSAVYRCDIGEASLHSRGVALRRQSRPR
jgi:hypothetical protein